jgi:Glycosyl transferases group 1
VRLFQNSALSTSYRKRLNQLLGPVNDFAGQRDVFLKDRFGAVHFLKPVLYGHPDAFFTNGDDERLQRAWASENGLSASSSLEDILLTQIEDHQTEVLYNLDPMHYGNSFLKRLPSCVKRTLTWRAAPSAGGHFDQYDVILNNFPSLLEGYRKAGMRAEYFTPAHDPIMDGFAANEDRPIDILFVGGYSRHHRSRAILLEAVAALSNRHKVVYHLDRSRMTRLAETPLGWLGPLQKHRRPSNIRAVSVEPVFGLNLYQAISRSKIVINGAVDMAGSDRGNIRCWEAMGCGALLLSDSGRYPDGMIDRDTMLTYDTLAAALAKCDRILKEANEMRQLSIRAKNLVAQRYSKEVQWQNFLRLA